MPALVLGPLLRYTGSTEATVWVETDSPCEVTVLDARARTFAVEGHHYALVEVHDLEQGAVRPYEVLLDAERAWPPDDGRPPSVIRTREHERRSTLVFGSCRVGAPEGPPYALPVGEAPEAVGVDALWAYSRRLQAGREPWPDCLLLLGDQVYADEVSPETAAFIRSRRDVTEEPGEEVADFEEYTRLYREAWSDPDVRWLLSTVPSTMIWDDHDVSDDWNSSSAWVEKMRRTSWWQERIVGAFMAYWLYQHLGNLAPPELAEEQLFAEVQEDTDAGPRLRRFAAAADRTTTSARFAFHRDFGRSRLVVVDSRAARVLTPGKRNMVDDEEWRWIDEHTRGDFDHLVIASTLPVFMGDAIHHLEAWSEAVCAGRWGRLASRGAEQLRRLVDLEHWPAFSRSFATMVDLTSELATPGGGEPPATITFIGGDVHTAYVTAVDMPEGAESRVHQVVCSPFRNPLSRHERWIIRLLGTRPVTAAMRRLARAAGVTDPAVRWRMLSGPTFENSIAVLQLDERTATVEVRCSGEFDDEGPLLHSIHRRELTAPA
jgi:hypothetical protein